jgi:hypothetical protein
MCIDMTSTVDEGLREGEIDVEDNEFGMRQLKHNRASISEDMKT